MWQVLGIVLLALCQVSHALICYSCSGTSATVGQTCSYDTVEKCDTSCQFDVAANGTWWSGCAPNTAVDWATQTCSYNATTKNTECFCDPDFCNDFDKTVDVLLEVWAKDSVEIPMVFPSQMSMECFECGQVNVPGFGLITLPCDAAHTCHGDYCVTKRGENPHSYCGTAWDGIPTVSCTKMPNQPEVCVCTESFCNPVLDPIQEPSPMTTSTSTTTVATPTKTKTSTTTAPAAITTTAAPTRTTRAATTTSTTTAAAATTTTSSAPAATTTTAAATSTTTPAATTTTAVPPVPTTTHPKCKDGSFNPNAQAVSMGEKLKNIISNAFNSVNLNWFQESIDEHICDYSGSS